MARKFSLAHLTTPGLHPVEMARIAGRAGYDCLGLRMTPVTPGGWCFPLMDQPAVLRETRAAMRDAGVGLLDVELLRLAPETDVASYEPLLAVSAELGAAHMLTQIHDDDHARAVDNLGAACDLAAQYGLTCDLEFLPWTANRNLETAAEFVREVAKTNAGVMIDTLHFDRSLSEPGELQALPAEWFRFMQLCDAPAERPQTLEGLLHHAREARDFPGDGGLDLKSVLRALPDGIPVGLEIPNAALDRVMSTEERVTKALLATKRLLADLDRDRFSQQRPVPEASFRA